MPARGGLPRRSRQIGALCVADVDLELELEAAEAPRETAEASDSIGRNTAFGAATQMTTAAFTAALTLYLVRALGPGDYGVFALSVSIGTLLMLASDFGLTGPGGRHNPELRGDPPPAPAGGPGPPA